MSYAAYQYRHCRPWRSRLTSGETSSKLPSVTAHPWKSHQPHILAFGIGQWTSVDTTRFENRTTLHGVRLERRSIRVPSHALADSLDDRTASIQPAPRTHCAKGRRGFSFSRRKSQFPTDSEVQALGLHRGMAPAAPFAPGTESCIARAKLSAEPLLRRPTFQEGSLVVPGVFLVVRMS